MWVQVSGQRALVRKQAWVKLELEHKGPAPCQLQFRSTDMVFNQKKNAAPVPGPPHSQPRRLGAPGTAAASPANHAGFVLTVLQMRLPAN